MLTGNPWLDLVLKAIVWALAAYMGAYLAQKAQHRAIREDLADALNRARSEAEAKKSGETDAIQKDLQRILDQLAETTSLTKQIESDIAYRSWDRQMRINLKHDLYLRLLEAIGEKIRTLQNLSRLETLLKDPRHDPERRDARLKNHRDLCDANNDQTGKIQAVAAIACVSLPPDTVRLLDSLSKQIRERTDHTMTAFEQMQIEAALYQDGFNTLAALARRDIGDSALQSG